MALKKYKNLIKWARQYDLEFCNLLLEKEEYVKQVLNIEREQKKPRKDFSCYSEIKNKIWYMFKPLQEHQLHDRSYILLPVP